MIDQMLAANPMAQQVNATPIALRYLQVGAEKKNALEILRSQGFRVSVLADRHTFLDQADEEELYATHARADGLGRSRETRVIVSIQEGRTTGVKGLVFRHFL